MNKTQSKAAPPTAVLGGDDQGGHAVRVGGAGVVAVLQQTYTSHSTLTRHTANIHVTQHTYTSHSTNIQVTQHT